MQLTSDTNDFANAKSHARKKPLLGGGQMCCFANQSYKDMCEDLLYQLKL